MVESPMLLFELYPLNNPVKSSFSEEEVNTTKNRMNIQQKLPQNGNIYFFITIVNGNILKNEIVPSSFFSVNLFDHED
jgi:hypothetical protein